MRRYKKPELNMEEFDIEDIITVSGSLGPVDPEEDPEDPDIGIDDDIIILTGGNPIQEVLNEVVETVQEHI